MVFEIFTALVAFLALIYAGTAKFIQQKLVNKKELEEIQKESKALSEELKKAKESGNEKRVTEVMEKQMKFLPRMNKVMFSQFKPMIVILALFGALMWVIGTIDPATQDDISIVLADDGAGCDMEAGDSIYSGCYNLEGANYGKWSYSAKAFDGDSEIGSNSTYFIYNSDTSDTFAEGPKGESVQLSTDKEEYYPGETVQLYAQSAKATSIKAVLDNGTHFSVELPLTIPLVNVKTIYQPYWWFILISLITNLSISIVMKQLGKKK